ncbi:MAG TPA: hypothetical protein VG889_07555 [Rhizomicrobium sp.]|nr:hypothetical protein [Rhizomicrobium sp.]
MLNETATKRYATKRRSALGEVIDHGRAHLHEVGYQLRASFILIVVVPTLIAAAYYLLIAAPRYVTTAQFAVWTATPPKADPLSMLVQLPGSSASLEDQHIVQDYVQSRTMLESIEKQFDLGHIYGSGGDIFAELWPGRTVEDRVRYWKRHVRITIDSTSSISTMEVDTFRPEDSLALINGILGRAQTMVQNLSDESDADAVRQTKILFDKAAAQLSEVRARVTQFRRENHMVDATHTGELTMQMVGGLEAQLTDAEAQIQQMRTYLAPNDPRIAVMQARADAVRKQIDLQKGGLAETNPAVPSQRGADVLPASVLAKSEALETELDVALKGYAAAAAAHYEAQGNLTRNRRYLEVFVKPALPEQAEKPERWRMIATIFVCAFIAWCLVITVGGAIRDHAGV